MKQFEGFALDTQNECLRRGENQIALAPRPFSVLRYMVENPGRLISHDELLDALWPETYVQPQVLRTYVLELRKVLGDDAGQPRFIQTLPKRGYCFVAPVTDATGVELGTATEKSAMSFDAVEPMGREAELAQLKAQFDLLARRQRRIVMIGGEAGIGKTALVDAFCRQLNVAKASNVARGQCIQGVCCKEDYYPVMEAIGELCASPSGGDVCRTLRTMAPAWMIHTAISQSKTVQAAPIGQHPRIIGDLCHALEEISAEMPLLLLFEDMEWADESTLNLISALARRRVPTRLMVLITYRPAKGSALQALKQDLLMRRLCKDIALTPLRKDAVRGLLSGELAQQLLPAGLETFVYRRAEGNPLFATAIVKHLISERILVHRGSEGRWELSVDLDEIDAGVPEELAQMIEMEIGRLADDEQQMLEAGSLMQVAFPSWAVAAALEEDESEVEAKCDALARRLYFVDRAGQDELPDGAHSAFYVFGHGLYREMLYQRQAATRRGERHIRIAERLSELFAGREADVAREMAMHFEAGGDWKRAAQALHMAAVRAEERHAYADAAESLEHALRIVENLPEKYRACEARDLLRILKEARAALGAGASSSEEGHAKV